jgi:hypothetical protein
MAYSIHHQSGLSLLSPITSLLKYLLLLGFFTLLQNIPPEEWFYQSGLG